MSELSQIAALLHERERHILGQRAERVAAIDRELAALGHVVETAVETVVSPVVGAVEAAFGRVETALSSAPLENTASPSPAV